jgi:predicted DNA-binding protein (UPF0251 family)
MCPCRGRRRGRRWISEMPQVRCFLPENGEGPEAVCLNLEELEAIRLVDLLELDQEDAAFYMGISRKAFWNDLASARRKIATALIYGTGLRIGGGSYMLREPGQDIETEEFSDVKQLDLMERELHLLRMRIEQLSTRIASQKAVKEEEKTLEKDT